MRVDTSGRVGIGTVPSAWTLAANLDVGAASVVGNSTNAYFSANQYYDGAWKYKADGFGTTLLQTNGNFDFYTAPTGLANAAATQTLRMRLTPGGDLGIGTSSPGAKLDIKGLARSSIGTGTGAGGSAYAFYQFGTSATATENWHIGTEGDGSFRFYNQGFGAGLERMRIDSSGNVGIGTSSPNTRLHVVAGDGVTITRLAGASYALRVQSIASVGCFVEATNNLESTYQPLILGGSQTQFTTSGTESARIDSSGNLLIGKTAASGATAGAQLEPSGLTTFVRSGGTVLQINRLSSDGNLIDFYQDTVLEGNISVSGNTVSYNAFAGSHWSQLQDGSKPEILRGTVMESIDELVQWPDEPTTERLCRSKVSDTAGSKRVYGVFMCWDEDWTATNDMLVTSLGAFICRVNAGVTVQMGDLLESNGDGTARVQADDIIRSSTIGKVTGTAKTHEYDDGSYCVPTVLYCG
jgi:hypothetical protein